ncbi:hypothetical protein TNCV_731181 [Trichonephila clavipes]|nr:hypothetical protein TNCV_731181 [Trichonephila clavipes]
MGNVDEPIYGSLKQPNPWAFPRQPHHFEPQSSDPRASNPLPHHASPWGVFRFETAARSPRHEFPTLTTRLEN